MAAARKPRVFIILLHVSCRQILLLLHKTETASTVLPTAIYSSYLVGSGEGMCGMPEDKVLWWWGYYAIQQRTGSKQKGTSEKWETLAQRWMAGRTSCCWWKKHYSKTKVHYQANNIKSNNAFILFPIIRTIKCQENWDTIFSVCRAKSWETLCLYEVLAPSNAVEWTQDNSDSSCTRVLEISIELTTCKSCNGFLQAQ